ncbi:unnamed protein product [Cylindrotheca closterium]|uniref:Protochlorophyllide reductase n=1 Tax=Cylindrotheca closterium TaxID=2856 RepID=A0AAD2G2P9_9STRA|nr:unnamed protein product [Cylindrotheca closterium]
MVFTMLSKASAYRNKYLPKAFTDSNKPKTAVVVGSTSGIGQGIAHRLAEQGWNVVAVGRYREGRAEEVVKTLNEYTEAIAKTKDGEVTKPQHSFVACDCFSLKSVQEASKSILEKHDTIDALVLTQGMATTQGFTPTVDGNDEKLTLHYFSRMAFACLLLPALSKSNMSNGPVILSVLSGGVHSPYKNYETDFDLKENYSVSNAANAAGFYNDLGLDALARKHPQMNFMHAAPGFVNTNWGTEFNPILRAMVRCMQPLGKSPADCAEFMAAPTILASEFGDDLAPKYEDVGVICFGGSSGKAEPSTVSKGHTAEAREFVWKQTIETLKKVGLDVSE